MRNAQAATLRSNTIAKPLLLGLALALLLAAMSAIAGQAQIRRPGRLQKKIEKMEQRRGTNKLNPSGNSTGSSPGNSTGASAVSTAESPAPKAGAQAGKHSLDGVREKGPLGIFRDEERQLMIPGFGNQAALIIIFRQLDLTDDQKQKIKGIRRQVGNRLGVLQNEHRQLDLQLTDAIYGENFDPKRAEELAAQVAEKQSEIIKLRANIESQLRQLMTPDQFYVFHFLIGEMVMPQRRIPPAQLRQQLQRRLGAPNRPNPQTPPREN
jgi:Spy/CpxP family protein refolding chaperone